MEIGSSEGSAFTTSPAAAAAAANMKVHFVDVVPVFVRELVAGGVAGACSKTAVAPLERVKILLQLIFLLHHATMMLLRHGHLLDTRTEGFQSIGIFQSLKKMKKHDGILGFYKGNGASVLRIVPYAALHFMAYEQYRCWILNNCPSLGTGPFIDLLAGSSAGGTAVICTYPLDLARAKLAYQVAGMGSTSRIGMSSLESQMANHGIKDVFRNVYMEGGLRSLYRGICPTLIGILPYAGLKFYIYEELKSHVPEKHQKSIGLRLTCGALAGLFGQTLTYPLDVVRRQMQVESQQMSSEQNDLRVKSTMQGLATIIRNQGWRQLFAGLSLNYLKVVPSVAIGFTVYENMKALLRVPSREKQRTVSAA